MRDQLRLSVAVQKRAPGRLHHFPIEQPVRFTLSLENVSSRRAAAGRRNPLGHRQGEPCLRRSRMPGGRRSAVARARASFRPSGVKRYSGRCRHSHSISRPVDKGHAQFERVAQ